jgi:hypothetical protein
MRKLAQQWAEETAQAQGLPVKVNDPQVLAAAAVLLAARETRAA